MSVDFFPCDFCGASICDCGHYVTCKGNDDNCGKRWCNQVCAKKDGYDYNDFPSCKYCRNEELEDYILVEFLLKELNLKREEAIKLFFEKNNETFDP